jgi:integral membrane protein (TIGR01906 family)
MNAFPTRGIASFLVATATTITLVGVGVAVFFNPLFVAFEQGRANVTGWTGFTAAQVRTATDAITGDLIAGGGDFAVTVDGAPVLNDPERAHMRDVRGVFGAFAVVVLSGAILLAVAGWLAGGAAWFWRAVGAGASVLAVAVVVLGAIALVAFDTLFTLFHELLFAGGTYTFDPRTDRLVQLFPDQFWSETSIALAVVLVLLAVGTRALSGRVLRVGSAQPASTGSAQPRPAR